MFSLAIVQFHMLHSLDHNQITDKGAGMLAKALKVNQSHASGGIFFISFIEYRVAGKFGGGGGGGGGGGVGVGLIGRFGSAIKFRQY